MSLTGDEGATPVPGNPAGFMAYQQQLGSSAREALAEWRSLGASSGNEAWYRQWGQVADTLNRIEGFAAVDPAALPSAADYGEWAMGQGGQYAVQVEVTATDIDTGLLTTSQFTAISDTPITGEEAVAQAMDEYGIEDNAAKYGQVIQYAVATRYWQTVPFGT